jgi:7-carboxy-7-deazaguanine synthase
MQSEEPELTVSELFVSIQGEGPSTGQPAAFVRLGNCNLTCTYCDTPYTWDFERFDKAKELRRVPIAEVATFLLDRSPGRVIVTGGEPLIQQKVLSELLDRVDQAELGLAKPSWGGRLFVEIETNGTICPLPALAERVDQWNVSPKLERSGEPRARRVKDKALAWFCQQPRAFFKFVVESGDDAREAAELARDFQMPAERVFLMPQAKNKLELEAREDDVRVWAEEHHFGMTSRLHLKLWDGARGT